jgi:hypothetical protein
LRYAAEIAIFTDSALPRCLTILSLIVPALVVAASVSFPNVVGRPWYVTFYVAPAICGFILWMKDRLQQARRYGYFEGLLDGAVILLCSLRMTAPLVPMSGHMLFFVYATITVRSWKFRGAAIALALETTVIKLAVWGDYRSWSLGIVSGLLLGVVTIAVRPPHNQALQRTGR